jgi:hypothetical protein
MLVPVLVGAIVAMFLAGLVRPSRTRRVQSMIDEVFSGRGE